MLSLFRRLSRKRGLRARRLRRGRRVARMIGGAAAVTTAVVLPLVLSFYDGSGGSADGSGSGTAAATSGTSSSSGSSTATGGSSGDGGGTSSGDASSSTGSYAASSTSGAGTSGSGAASAGSLDGFVLAFDEEPAGGSVTDPAMDSGESSTSTSDGSGDSGVTVSGTPSAFDYYPDQDLLRIEEDWELTVSAPDGALAAPQTGTVMTPFEDADSFHLTFVLNHRDSPSFSAGGMELQLWYQGQQLGWLGAGNSLLNTPNEQVTWTQRLDLEGSQVRFSVIDGSSTTWGSFGQGDSLHLSIQTTLTDLNDYHPNVSVENSGVTFASNRVGSLVLKAVRGYDKYGYLVVEDTEPVVVFSPTE